MYQWVVPVTNFHSQFSTSYLGQKLHEINILWQLIYRPQKIPNLHTACVTSPTISTGVNHVFEVFTSHEQMVINFLVPHTPVTLNRVQNSPSPEKGMWHPSQTNYNYATHTFI